MSKILILTCFLIFIPSLIFAGELYETEDYLYSTTGMNPYDTDDRSPQAGLPDFSIPFNNDSGNGGTGNSGNDGNSDNLDRGNSSQSFSYGIPHNTWTNQNNRNQSNTGTKDYLARAILINTGFVRSRGRYAKFETPEAVGDNIKAVSFISFRIRKVRDEQVAVAKITRAIKIQGTRFDSCFDISVNGFSVGNTDVDTIAHSASVTVCSFLLAC